MTLGQEHSSLSEHCSFGGGDYFHRSWLLNHANPRGIKIGILSTTKSLWSGIWAGIYVVQLGLFLGCLEVLGGVVVLLRLGRTYL